MTKETKESPAPAPTARALMLAKGAELSIIDLKEMATMVSRSGLFPSAKTPEAAFALMMLCQAEGLHPIQAVRRYHVIQGTASMKAEAILGDYMNAGGRVEWKDYTHEKVTGVFEAPGLSKPVAVTWTLEDAKRAKLEGKDNWKNYPRQMLKARVITDGVRMAMPSIMVGILSAEEAEDLPPPTPSIPVEGPKRTAPAQDKVVDVEPIKAAAPPPAPAAAEPETPETEPLPDEGGQEVCVTDIFTVSWKKEGAAYHYFATDSKKVVYFTSDRLIANVLKGHQDKKETAMVWYTRVVEGGFERLQITRAS